MAAEGGVRLFAGNQQEVAVGEAAAAFEIDLLLLEAEGAGILGMRIGVEIGQDGDVDPQAAEHVEAQRGCRSMVPASVSCSS